MEGLDGGMGIEGLESGGFSNLNNTIGVGDCSFENMPYGLLSKKREKQFQKTFRRDNIKPKKANKKKSEFGRSLNQFKNLF